MDVPSMQSGRSASVRETTRTTLDGNEVAARIAYLTNEVIAIYPITPASPIGEWADQWASEGRKNLWGTIPQVVEMQSRVSPSLHR